MFWFILYIVFFACLDVVYYIYKAGGNGYTYFVPREACWAYSIYKAVLVAVGIYLLVTA